MGRARPGGAGGELSWAEPAAVAYPRPTRRLGRVETGSLPPPPRGFFTCGGGSGSSTGFPVRSLSSVPGGRRPLSQGAARPGPGVLWGAGPSVYPVLNPSLDASSMTR